MQLKTAEEIEIIHQNCLITNGAIAAALTYLKEGITTNRLDKIIEEYIGDHRATPSFKGYGGYPFASCISVNDAVVHGFPNEQPLQLGDIISIDAGSFANGFHSDSAYTVLLGEADLSVYELLRTTEKALYAGIAAAVSGNRIGDIGCVIQQLTETEKGYGVVRDLVGHGIGRNIHEPPNIPNYGRRGRGTLLKENLVIAIEPMINLGTHHVLIDKDGWTVRTKDGSPSAHYEHVVAVQKGKARILSDFAPIEQAIAKNDYLWKA